MEASRVYDPSEDGLRFLESALGFVFCEVNDGAAAVEHVINVCKSCVIVDGFEGVR